MTATGCRCTRHFGLAEYMTAIGRPTFGLPAAELRADESCRPDIRLHVVTRGPDILELIPCDGSYTCECPDHVAERATFVQRGAQGEGRASPFKLRPAA